MFAVVFEVQPRPDQWDAYLGLASLLRPELLKIDGFLENIRYRSRRRDGVLLSLSTWRDEEALIRWRTQATHEGAQSKGRSELFQDYHLRVGEVIGTGTGDDSWRTLSLIDAPRPRDLPEDAAPSVIARRLGLPVASEDLLDWDVFEAILTQGDMLLLLSWRTGPAAPLVTLEAARHRQVRILRDYGLHRRDEAPRFYPPVPRV